MKRLENKFSIIMPVLNSKNTLEKAIQSVLEQDFSYFELIVMDGGSTDGTLDIIKKYEKYLGYWRSGKDNGPSYNEGIEHATGNIIAFLNADDWYMPGLFKSVSDKFLEDETTEVVSCFAKVFEQQNNGDLVELRQYMSKESILLNLENVLFGAPLVNARFYRNTVFKKIGVFRHFDEKGNYIISADREFLLYAALQHLKNAYVESYGFAYRKHPNSITFGATDKVVKKTLIEHLNLFENNKMNAALNLKESKLMRSWYCDQGARLFVREILSFNFKKAANLFIKFISQYPLEWIMQFFLIPSSILMNRLRCHREST